MKFRILAEPSENEDEVVFVIDLKNNLENLVDTKELLWKVDELKKLTVEASFKGSWNYNKNFEYPDAMPKDVWNIKSATLTFEVVHEADKSFKVSGSMKAEDYLNVTEVNEELWKALYYFTSVNIPMA
jgi:hypothetical protein